MAIALYIGAKTRLGFPGSKHGAGNARLKEASLSIEIDVDGYSAIEAKTRLEFPGSMHGARNARQKEASLSIEIEFPRTTFLL